MGTATGATRPGKARQVPLYRSLPSLVREPLTAFEKIGSQAGGEVVQINLAGFRPYLVTHPDDVRYVLREHASNFLREGMLWKPMRRFLGTGIFSDGPDWATSRTFMQPLFSAKNVASMMDRMASAITAAVDDLDRRVQSGQVLDAATEMARIAYRAVIRVFFGDRISVTDGERLIHALDAIATSVTSRLILPFMPDAAPMPGDRAFRRATQLVDSIMFPLVHESRAGDGTRDDIITGLCQARDDSGAALDDQQVRDYVVSLLAAGTETTTMALTWIWVALHANPAVAATLDAEIDATISEGPVRADHLPRLRYTRMVIQETLRLYPVGWIFPRQASAADVIGGVRISSGATVLLSPYLTHRMEEFWPRPHSFEPDRFAPDADDQRHRFAYFPFSGGIHQCLGSHFFTVEAQLIVATVLSRYRTRVVNPGPVSQRAGVTLRPGQPVQLILEPKIGAAP